MGFCAVLSSKTLRSVTFKISPRQQKSSPGRYIGTGRYIGSGWNAIRLPAKRFLWIQTKIPHPGLPITHPLDTRSATETSFLKNICLFGCDGIFSCSMWNLVPWPVMKPGPPALGVQNLNHWTTRGIPNHIHFLFFLKQTNLSCATELSYLLFLSIYRALPLKLFAVGSISSFKFCSNVTISERSSLPSLVCKTIWNSPVPDGLSSSLPSLVASSVGCPGPVDIDTFLVLCVAHCRCSINILGPVNENSFLNPWKLLGAHSYIFFLALTLCCCSVTRGLPW